MEAYTPGKAWEEKLDHWLRDGFRRVEPLFSSEPLADMPKLLKTRQGSAYIYTQI